MVRSQVTGILTLLALCCGICNADSIPATLYCTTLGPTGLIILDLSTGKESRLTTGHVDHIAKGEDGYIAITHDDRIEAFHYKKRVGVIEQTAPDLVGWLDDSLVFRSKGKVYTLNTATGKVQPSFLNSYARSVCMVNKRILVVEEHEAFTILSLFNPNHRLIYQWKNTKGTPASEPLVKDDRWIVLEIYKEGELTPLWIVDTRLKAQSYFAVENWGLADGHIPKEIVICRPKREVSTGNVGTTEVVSLNLETAKTHTITGIAGIHSLVGLSNDGNWLLTQTFPAEVGPGDLNAIRLSDKKMTILRHQVYHCFLISAK